MLSLSLRISNKVSNGANFENMDNEHTCQSQASEPPVGPVDFRQYRTAI